MRHIIFVIAFYFIMITSYAQQELRVFPKNINIEDYTDCLCEYDTTLIKDKIIKKDFGDEGRLSYDYSRFKFVDLNSDNKCEVIHYFSSGVRGWPNDFMTIYSIQQESNIHKMADLGSFFVSFAESDSNFIQLNHTYFKGHKTNPIYYVETWKVIGNTYKKFYSPDLTRGEFKKYGIAAYKSKKYEEAFICFNNVLLFPHHSSNDYLNSLNDVAITLIKQRKCEKVEPLLKSYIEKASDSKSKASAYFNIGLAKEFDGKKEEALAYYKKSLKQNWTKTAEEKVKNNEH